MYIFHKVFKPRPSQKNSNIIKIGSTSSTRWTVKNINKPKYWQTNWTRPVFNLFSGTSFFKIVEKQLHTLIIFLVRSPLPCTSHPAKPRHSGALSPITRSPPPPSSLYFQVCLSNFPLRCCFWFFMWTLL